MTRWRTDKPVAPVQRTRGVAGVAGVAMFRANPVAERDRAMARAFYARKLRLWALARRRESDKEPDST